MFNSNGVLNTLTPGTATGTAAIEIGGDGGYWDSSLITKLKSNQIFGRFDYDLTDNIQVYAQFRPASRVLAGPHAIMQWPSGAQIV